MPSPRATALNLLKIWETDANSRFAVQILDDAVSSGRLEAKNRPQVQLLLYAVIRNQLLLDHVAKSLATGKLDPKTRRVLRVGLAEVLLLDSAPHALVNEAVKLAGWAKGVVNAILRRALDEKSEILAGFADLPPQTRWSVPKLLWKRWVRQFGEDDAVKLAEWNNRPAPVFLRINRLKSPQPDSWPESLVPVANQPDYLEATGELPKDLLADGQVYAQDPSTAAAIQLLELKSGQRVLDACAAPGGKTLAIANCGVADLEIVATDGVSARTQRMRENFRNLSVETAEIRTVDWLNQRPEDDFGQFDRVLLDAPCSNTGVIRRRIDVPWRLQKTDFKQLVETQRNLLKSLAQQVKPGGILIYSTCSLDEEENENVVSHFLSENPTFSLGQQVTMHPWKDEFDGAFAAQLIRQS